MVTRKFDLNIEKILEDWERYHALREVIANALDEQLLTGTREVQIFKDRNDCWHVRDHGRGLRYEHLTQREDPEKLKDPRVIGKFGIGLKDALATLDRRRVRVLIKSKFGDITLGKSEKHGFEDITTLHAIVSPPMEPNMVGTEFVLTGITDDDVDRAKDLFLRFSGERLIEDTRFGQLLERKGPTARVYINGVRVADEDKFLFSYNITALTAGIRKALNRERTNVGRTAYADRIKSVLVSCAGQEVAERLAEDMKGFETGELHDELKWVEVQERAVKILNAQKRVVFLTPEELRSETMMVDEARRGGFGIVTIPGNLQGRIQGARDITGAPIRDLGQFHTEYLESFKFAWVDPKQLTLPERRIFDLTPEIFRLVGGRPSQVRKILVSETMRKELGSFVEADGLWDASSGAIIVKRSALRTREAYAGTLLHEAAHAIGGFEDVTREFELELTRLLGLAVSRGLSSR